MGGSREDEALAALVGASAAVPSGRVEAYGPHPDQRIEWYAWAFSLFLIGMLFATVVAGRLSDPSPLLELLGDATKVAGFITEGDKAGAYPPQVVLDLDYTVLIPR